MNNKIGKYVFIVLLLISIVSLLKRYSMNKDFLNSLGMSAVIVASAVAILLFLFAGWWGWYKNPLRKCPICKKLLNGDYEMSNTSPRDAKVMCKKCGNVYKISR